MCSCLPLDATTVNPILFAPQMVPRKLLPKPLNQMAGTSANDSQELTSQDANEGDDVNDCDFSKNVMAYAASAIMLPYMLDK